jgi:hypothetical protein
MQDIIIKFDINDMVNLNCINKSCPMIMASINTCGLKHITVTQVGDCKYYREWVVDQKQGKE